jgi:hypothetical protein
MVKSDLLRKDIVAPKNMTPPMPRASIQIEEEK